MRASGSQFSMELPDNLPRDGRVQWEARSYDGASYSPWSSSGRPERCTFHYDRNVPLAPVITSPEYPASDPGDPQDPWHDGVGRYGDFTFDTAAPDATRYRYGLNSDPELGNQISTGDGAARTARLLPGRAGVNYVTAEAVDDAGNVSETRTYIFRVRAGSPERMAWNLDEDQGAQAAFGQGAAWEADLTGDAAPGATGVRDGALHLGGQGGHATTVTPVLDTSKSFSVSLWARLPDTGPSTPGTAVSQAGKNGNGFQLTVDPGAGGWSFGLTTADGASEPVRRARQGGAAALGAWTHVVGVFRNPTQELLLYVDGRLVGSTTYAAPWEARGVTALGALMTGQDAGQYFHGDLDEVHFYDYWLTDAQVAGLHTHQPVTASGRPAVAVFALDEEEQEAAAVTGLSQPATASVHGSVAFGGGGVRGTSASFTSGAGYAATTQPVLDTYQSFAVAAWVRLPAGKANQNMVVAAQSATTNWGFSLVHAPDGRGWTFRRWDADDPGGSLVQASQHPCSATNPACAAARLGEWTHVVGVHDIDRSQIRLYVDGRLEATESFTGRWTAQGRVTIGMADHRDGTPSGELTGQIDDVRFFDRMVTAGEARQLFHQSPVLTSRWQFEQGTATSTPNSVDGQDDRMGHPLTLGGGPALGPGAVGSRALLLDGVNDHAATTTVPMDTSASFTVTAWAQAAALPARGLTLVGAAGDARSAFAVRYEPDGEGGSGDWQLVLRETDDTEATAVSIDHNRFFDVRDWNHVAVVYDGFRREARLYVNGQLDETACVEGSDESCGSVSWAENVNAFAADHSLQVGRARTDPGAWGQYWSGAVDDLWTFQGALSGEQVAYLAFSSQDIPTQVPPGR